MTTKRKVEIVKLKNGMQMVAVTSTRKTRKTSSDQSRWSKLIQLTFVSFLQGWEYASVNGEEVPRPKAGACGGV